MGLADLLCCNKKRPLLKVLKYFFETAGEDD
jgi:hypothetical protein